VDIKNIDAIHIRKTIYIHGSQHQFNQEKQKLCAYSIINVPVKEDKGRYSFSRLPDKVVDFDGNNYKTVTLGGQVWMAENLKVTHYRNGEPIPMVTDNSEWSRLTEGAYCNYKNDSLNGILYGRLYNGSAIQDIRNLCPAGWHVPSQSEWTSLVTTLGGETKAGGKMKEYGTSHWKKPNDGIDPESSFAIPGGYRDFSGSCRAIGEICQWWTSTAQDSIYLHSLYLNNLNADVIFSTSGKISGLSVRCNRD